MIRRASAVPLSAVPTSIGDARPGNALPGRYADGVCDVPGADPERVRVGRAHLLSPSGYAELAETFRALSDTSRARIVHSLLRQELCTCDLAAIAGISEPAVSQHLRQLKALRVVKSRREGKKVYYSLDDAHVRFLLRVSLSHLAHSPDTEDVAPGGSVVPGGRSSGDLSPEDRE